MKILSKLAQTDPNVPTTQVATNKQIPPAPAITASEAYPNIRSGYSQAQIPIIDSIVQKLNIASNIATGGTYNLQILRNRGFSFDPSSFPSPDQKNLMNFFLKIFKNLLNSGNSFRTPLIPQQLTEIVEPLIQAPELKNLSQINPTGPIAQQIPGNLQQDIKNDLMRLLPTVAVRTV